MCSYMLILHIGPKGRPLPSPVVTVAKAVALGTLRSSDLLAVTDTTAVTGTAFTEAGQPEKSQLMGQSHRV
jgi:hypothetical protein